MSVERCFIPVDVAELELAGTLAGTLLSWPVLGAIVMMSVEFLMPYSASE